MPPAEDKERKAVGVYDRPHPLTRPRVWIPIVVAVIVSIAWYFILK
jgi:hypothetical protein